MNRIALLLPCLLTGGTEVVTLATARALQEMGFAVDVVVYFDEVDPSMLDTFRQSGIVVVASNIQRTASNAHVLLALFLFRTLFKNRYSVVWLQYMTPTLMPLLIARCFTSCLIATVHVAANHYSAVGIRRIRWLARHWCTRFVCVSHTVAKGLFGKDLDAGVYSCRVAVIPNSLDVKEVYAAQVKNWRSELGWESDRVIIGYCGRLATIKGADILVESVRKLLDEGKKISLVMIGEGEQRPLLESLCARWGMEKHLHFGGRLPRSEIYSAIKGFDIAVVPSREEGFGLSALEAMAAGVPLVASAAGALPEITNGGKNAVLFESDNVDDLTRALLSVINSPAMRSELATKAVQYVGSLYSQDAFTTAVSGLMQSVGLPSTRSDWPG